MFRIISLYSGELLSEMLATTQSTALKFKDEFTGQWIDIYGWKNISCKDSKGFSVCSHTSDLHRSFVVYREHIKIHNKKKIQHLFSVLIEYVKVLQCSIYSIYTYKFSLKLLVTQQFIYTVEHKNNCHLFLFKMFLVVLVGSSFQLLLNSKTQDRSGPWWTIVDHG